MKKLTFFSLILITALTVWSCSDGGSTGPDPGPDPPPTEASSEKQFVYNAMNEWYYWQTDVSDLADDRFADDDAKQEYLSGFASAQSLFNDLLFREDDFSFFIEDYEEFEDEQDGILSALGINYGFFRIGDGNQVVGYVRYVLPDSPAEDAGLQRLDLFTHVDGTQLNTDNFISLLSDDTAHDLTLAELESTDTGVIINETETVTVQSEQIVEDPIYRSEVIERNGIKIGYLMYNAFQGNSHQNLNDAFGDFQAQGINELVLDLRYNGGGLVLTSQLLSSLISGLGSSNIFAEFEYGTKKSDLNQTINFLDDVPIRDEQGNFNSSEPINSLSLTNLYVLTSSATASASEALINGLSPYMDVTIIGLKTVGKDEGSLTLYDAAPNYTNKQNINPDHKKAIQPIVLKIVNSQGNDYPTGLEPNGYNGNIAGGCPDDNNDNCINEITVQNLQEKPELGSPDEPLLARAIGHITGQTMSQAPVASRRDLRGMELIMDRDATTQLGKGMYVNPSMLLTPSEN